MGAHELVRLTDAVDLSTIRGRSLCVRYAVNIRLLVAMQRNFLDGIVISLGSTRITSSSAVTILHDHVMKKAFKHSGCGSFETTLRPFGRKPWCRGFDSSEEEIT